jgi:hypothetical protein
LYLHHPNVEKFVCLLEIELETIHETGPKILEFGKKNAINGAIVF